MIRATILAITFSATAVLGGGNLQSEVTNVPPELNETLSAYLIDSKGWGAEDFALKIKSVNKDGMLVVWATHASDVDASVSLIVHPDSHDVVKELAFQ